MIFLDVCALFYSSFLLFLGAGKLWRRDQTVVSTQQLSIITQVYLNTGMCGGSCLEVDLANA